ncbi:hypothetical protein D5125_06190 [Magnetovirga frankeli]|uniref:hypothetical protein n=1 Tax=Magnetovirga frankeli TaxID=947516 RepID=UPI00129331D2|nr:hypothetical protein D5125_06190 [gamma proteobacterium SS-5]
MAERARGILERMRSDEAAGFMLAAQAVAKEATDFSQVWRDGEASLLRHIGDRIKLGHAKDVQEYIRKTCDCLEDATAFATARGGYERMVVLESADWTLVYTESGMLVTSFQKVKGRETPKERYTRLRWQVSEAEINDYIKAINRGLRLRYQEFLSR